MIDALQPDLFRSVEPELQIARTHEHNDRCLHQDDCLWEEHKTKSGLQVELGFGKTDSGWCSAYGYKHRFGGECRPVFKSPEFKTYVQAREAAVKKALEALAILYTTDPIYQNGRDEIRELTKTLL
jgi:hypothetical protein